MSLTASFDPAVYQEALSDLQLAHETLDRSPKKNWVEKAGGLPQAIVHMAKDIHEEKGVPISQAIAIAVSQAKKLAAKGNVKYIKAVAEWEKMKAKTHLSAAVIDVDFDYDRFALHLAQARQSLDLATFDESKHPRLKGRFIRVGHVLKDTAGKNYKVEKVSKDAIHVRQTRTSPGQEHHDPTDTPLGGLHKIENDNISKVFKEHAVTKTKEDVQADKDLEAEKKRQQDYNAPVKKGDAVSVKNADGSAENGTVISVTSDNVKVRTADGDDYNYDHNEVSKLKTGTSVGGDSSKGRGGERVAGDKGAAAIPSVKESEADKPHNKIARLQKRLEEMPQGNENRTPEQQAEAARIRKEISALRARK